MNNLSLWQKTPPIAAGHSWVMAISKKTAPTVILHYFELPGAYTGQTQLHTFAAIDDVMWYYQLFESLDGTPTGTVRNYFDVQPNKNSYATRDDLYLTADVTAAFASGTNFYGPDSTLIGWNWSLERVGQGTREVGVKYIKTIAGVDTTNDDTEADGWRTFDPLDLINLNEEWCIHFYPQLQAVSSSSSGSVVSATRILTANTALDSTAIGQSFWLMGGAGYFEVTLPDLATIPDNEPLYFMSDGGSHVNVGLKCVAGQSLQYYNNSADLSSDTRATKIILGQQQKIAFYKITMTDSSYRFLLLYGGEENNMVGEIITTYSKLPINTVFADGRKLSRTTYARLWARVQEIQAADPSAVIADGAFDATEEFDGIQYYINHGKYTTGDGSTTFGIPKLYAGIAQGTGFLRMIDGSDRAPGSFQVDAMEELQHETTIGTLPTTLFGKGSVRVKGNYNGQASGQTDLTSKPGLIVGSTWQFSEKLSYENRPVNFGVYGLIRI